MAAIKRPKRLRLRAWLVQQIDNGRIPGLEWVYKEQGIFKVPWKHASRHSYNREKDSALFREWATYTGKFQPGADKEDSKKWKTNFRCALNALPDVCEVKEESDKRGKDAFKVYKIDRNRQMAKASRKKNSNQQRGRKRKSNETQHSGNYMRNDSWFNHSREGSPYGQVQYPWKNAQETFIDIRMRSESLDRYAPHVSDQEVRPSTKDEDIAKLVDELLSSGAAYVDRNIEPLYSNCNGMGSLWPSDTFPSAATRLCHYGDQPDGSKPTLVPGISTDGLHHDDPILNSRI